MIDTARRSALHALDRAQVLWRIAESAGSLDDRLADGMFTLDQQLRVAAGFAMRAVLPPLGLSVPDLPDALSFPEVIDVARSRVENAEGVRVAKVEHRAGFADLCQTSEDYIARFALPNLWFHLGMAYAILRARGVAIGKAEFDGLHAYPEGFSL